MKQYTSPLSLSPPSSVPAPVPALLSVVIALGSVTATGCAGQESKPASCEGPLSPGPSPVRRLTQTEYNNTVYQLLGDTSYPANSFAPDEEANGFSNQASALVVSPLLAEQYLGAAESLAATHSQKLLETEVPVCAAASVDPDACAAAAEAFIRDFGLRAFRRPLSEAEVSLHKDLFLQGTQLSTAGYDPKAGIELVVQAMLQSPHFLYRVEFGRPGAEGDIVELTPYEMASRLSYFLWGTMPDASLFEAAARDELRTPAQIEAQARRMLAAPRARETVKDFHRQWLGLDEMSVIAAAGRDPEQYPDYHEGLLALWQKETELFLDHAIFEEEADVSSIFTASYSMMNRELAEFYGIPSPPPGDTFVPVELDPSRSAGFLTHAALLARYSNPAATSPVLRGKFVREKVLCQSPPAPPPIVPEPPNVDTSKTTREQYKEHSESSACAGCHSWMDPLGFGFENFDAIGRYRAEQNGRPIDASGSLTHMTDAEEGAPPRTFTDVVGMAQHLANSDQVRECVSTQWFRYAYGRAETAGDACSIDTINQAFRESGWDIQELLVAITQTDAFRYLNRVPTEENR